MGLEATALNLVKAEQRFETLKRNHDALQSLILTEMYKAIDDRAVIEGDWGGRKVVVKLLLSNEGQRKTSDIYNMQSNVFNTLKAGRNRMPEILYHIPNEGLFIFEFINGVSFDKLITGASRKEAETHYYNAGQWLHDYTAPTKTKSHVFHKKILKRAEAKIEYISKSINAVHNPKLVEIARQMYLCVSVLAKRIGPSNIDRAVTHMDYYPRNIMRAGNITYGIDIENTGHMFVFSDLARFLIGASRMQLRDHPLKYGMDEAFLRALLAGYGTSYDTDTLHTLRFFIAQSILDHLCTKNLSTERQIQFSGMAQQFIREYGTV